MTTRNITVLQKDVKFDLSLPSDGSRKKILEEILQLGGEILRRILIVTSLGWKEVYGVEAVKTLWPLSGNTFSRTTAPCIYRYTLNFEPDVFLQFLLDAIASNSTYPCQSVSEWASD